MLRSWIFFCLCSLFVTSCAKQNFRSPKLHKDKGLEQSQTLVHTVKYPGETLAFIAEWYTGSMANWREIAKFNPGLNPNLIRLGDQIKIPSHLVKRTDPLPKPRSQRVESKQPSLQPEQGKESQSPLPKQTEQLKKVEESKIKSPTSIERDNKELNNNQTSKAISADNQPKTETSDPKNQPEEKDSRERIRKELLKELLE